MYEVMGYSADHPQVRIACEAIEKLVVIKEHEAYVQPCVSPVWDTALASHALLESGGLDAEGQARAGLDWLVPRQVLD
ncbi:hypothetical protein, partial [Serratia marcescens]